MNSLLRNLDILVPENMYKKSIYSTISEKMLIFLFCKLIIKTKIVKLIGYSFENVDSPDWNAIQCAAF